MGTPAEAVRPSPASVQAEADPQTLERTEVQQAVADVRERAVR